MAKQPFSVLILAAGKATRFKSEHSKVLHRLAGRPLGEYVLRAAEAVEPEAVFMVIGHEAEEVRKTFARPGVLFIEQQQQLGTGHALLVARPELARCPSPALVVLVGDAPLLSGETILELVAVHTKARAAATVLTTRLENPHGYGRVVRAGGSRVRAIIEEKLCTPAQKKIREVNSGILCFDRGKLLEHLDALSADNPQKEYLLTDLIKVFNQHRERVVAFPAAEPREVLGVNDRLELCKMEKTLRLGKAESLMREGVTVVDPEVTYIDQDVEVGRDTVIEPGVSLLGATRVGSGCTLRAYSTIQDSVLGDRVLVRPNSVVTGCEVASDVIIGPFAHLRDGAVIERDARVGNFVEVKRSRVGRGAKAWHLTYLGDATLGEKANIGAGTVTCNYDGEKKNPTFIEEGCFIGSGTMLVAPVRIGRGAYVAAGSTITDNVPPKALALGRARQTVKEGWVDAQPKPTPISATSVRKAGAVSIFDVRGRLTMGEATRAWGEDIRKAINDGQKQVLVNLSGLSYIDSSGMGELMAAFSLLRGGGGEFKLSGVPEKVLRLFEAANLHRVFEIHVDEPTALASFRKIEPA